MKAIDPQTTIAWLFPTLCRVSSLYDTQYFERLNQQIADQVGGIRAVTSLITLAN